MVSDIHTIVREIIMFHSHPIRLRTNNSRFILPVFIKIATIAGILFSILSGVAIADKKSPQEEIFFQQKTMLGDFDEMVKIRKIRALVAYSKTFYFLDQGRQYGLSYETLREFEKFINKKLKTKTLKVQVVFIPVSRDELIPSLLTCPLVPQTRRHRSEAGSAPPEHVQKH